MPVILPASRTASTAATDRGACRVIAATRVDGTMPPAFPLRMTTYAPPAHAVVSPRQEVASQVRHPNPGAGDVGQLVDRKPKWRRRMDPSSERQRHGQIRRVVNRRSDRDEQVVAGSEYMIAAGRRHAVVVVEQVDGRRRVEQLAET